MIIQEDHWMSILGDIYQTSILRDWNTTNDSALQAAYGFVLALSLLHEISFMPILPFLLLLLLHGFDTAIDAVFLDRMAPDILTRLSSWPPQHPSLLNVTSDLMAMVIEYLPNTPVRYNYILIYIFLYFIKIAYVRSRLESSDREDFIEMIRKQLLCAMLFGTIGYTHIENHVVITTIKQGFLQVFSEKPVDEVSFADFNRLYL